jgi:hypothetical protein
MHWKAIFASFAQLGINPHRPPHRRRPHGEAVPASGLLHGHVGFHDCRHLFISYAVMSGVDYMTIAR